MKTLLFIIGLSLIYEGHAKLDPFRNVFKEVDNVYKVREGGDVGDPLILTPYLQKGRIEEAQQAALVKNSNFEDVISYAGYFTVDDKFDSNLWFWFFPSADSVEKDPVVLWLNGGPGVTSLLGLFNENGPYNLNDDETLSLREFSWHKNHSMIYIDNPVGVGFSFTNGGLAENQTKVGEDLHSSLTQFFQLFPDLQENPFYISGESYAGKYVPALSYTILKKNPDADIKINLQGLLIGNGWTDPFNQINYGPFVYNTGLVSIEVKEQIDDLNQKAIESAKNGDYDKAGEYQSQIIPLIAEQSGVNIYNYLQSSDDIDYWPDFLNGDEIRKSLHVGNVTFADKGAGEALNNALDGLKSVATWVEELLENYRTLIYVGQTDIICGYPMTLDFLRQLNFSGAEAYKTAERQIWYVDEEAAGYVTIGGNLMDLLVRNAGHLVPRDAPRAASDMLYKFTRNIPLA